jgi:DUF1365 family protein
MNAQLQHTANATAQAQTAAALPTTSVLRSAIYIGWVRHRREQPHAHAFRYRVAMLYLDLDEIQHVFDGRWLWSNGRGNLATFRREDYLGPTDIPLHEAVRLCVFSATRTYPRGPIRLLTHLRYYGYVFNPVSFYYCYAEDGQTLQAIVAEITNTPWRERHAYVLQIAEAQTCGRALHWQFAKRFHVSPFMPMDCDYAWSLTPPGDDLLVHMDVLRQGQHQFDASMKLQRLALDGRGLARVLLRYPAMTMKVIAAIHWQALLIFLRRNPVHDHPGKIAQPRARSRDHE